MKKEKFNELYSFLFPNGNSRKFCKQIFKIFSTDGTGEIEFIDLMFAISLTSTGEIDKKINVAFKIYDIDKNGLIDKRELNKIIEAIYELSESKTKKDLSREEIELIMKELDKNNDQFISKEEFIDGCLNNKNVTDLLFPVI